MRHSNLRVTRKTVGWVLAASLFVAAVPALELRLRSGEPDFTYMKRSNPGFGPACNYRNDFVPQPACQSSSSPTILVWGDSLAMQFVPGMLQHRGSQEIVQATRSACAPVLRLSTFSNEPTSVYDRAFAEKCTDFNDSVLRYLASADSPKIVALGGNFGAFMWDKLRLLEDRTHVRSADLETALRYLKRTIETVRGLGKQIVIVSPVPTVGVDIGRCSERMMTRRLVVGPNSNCEISVASYRVWHGARLELFARIQREADVAVIRFEDLLCAGGSCRTTMEGKLLYRDGTHLTHAGSELVARKSGLVGQILAKAR